LMMRRGQIDTSKDPWVYSPPQHKNAHRGHERTIRFGPRAQEILKPFMDRDADAFLFSPKEAEAHRYAQATVHRRPNQKPNPRESDRELRAHYDEASYRRAIQRACVKADELAHEQNQDVPKEQVLGPVWSPHQLRHTAATEIEEKYGYEEARLVLGHKSVKTTAIYAKPQERRAARVMAEIG